METLETVKKSLTTDRPKDFQDCVVFARNLFQENYSNSIRQLLFNFPADQVINIGYIMISYTSVSMTCHMVLYNSSVMFSIHASNVEVGTVVIVW